MKHYLFGMDQKEPVRCAGMLRERGIEAVISGSFTPEAASALEAEGIDTYLCYGAYGVKPDGVLAQDPSGAPRAWFSSGCPNDWENAQRHLDAVLEKARNLPNLRGILVDGARFASFASVEGVESFFTCFCPRCMQAMTDMELNAEAIRAAVKRLMDTRMLAESDTALIHDWLRFREQTVQNYMDRFAQRVHDLRGDLIAGAFIFAPSLGQYVGQTLKACRSLDVIAHMLYRDYHQEFGVACLGHEWAALVRGFGQNANAFLQATNAPFIVNREADDLRQHGFEPEWVANEISLARAQTTQQLWPILQLQDDRAVETLRLSQAAGADAVGFFAYGHADVPQL